MTFKPASKSSATFRLRQPDLSAPLAFLPNANLPANPIPPDAERLDGQLAESAHESDSADTPQRYRTIWLSDIHLGSGGCQAPYLLDFLRHHESEYLYLVGDIIDGWQLRKGWFWPQAHNDVVQKILRKARKGTQVVYIPGNHDEAARQFCDLAFGDIHVRGEAFHTTLAGKRLWIVHGDLFDGVIQHAKWLADPGDTLYTLILLLNRWFNRARTRLGLNYWSLSQYLKHQVKNAVNIDPPTYGHLDIIGRAATLFDQVTVAVLVNDAKVSLFSVDERIEMLRHEVRAHDNVVVDSFTGLLVDFCVTNGIVAIVKGLRAVTDFDYELQMAQMNRSLAGIETVFVPTSPEWSFIASSLVKEVARFGGDVAKLVPSNVLGRLTGRLGTGSGETRPTET